jgi:hypothetical protein
MKCVPIAISSLTLTAVSFQLVVHFEPLLGYWMLPIRSKSRQSPLNNYHLSSAACLSIQCLFLRR